MFHSHVVVFARLFFYFVIFHRFNPGFCRAFRSLAVFTETGKGHFRSYEEKRNIRDLKGFRCPCNVM